MVIKHPALTRHGRRVTPVVDGDIVGGAFPNTTGVINETFG
jgi:hypothetical protein